MARSASATPDPGGRPDRTEISPVPDHDASVAGGADADSSENTPNGPHDDEYEPL